MRNPILQLVGVARKAGKLEIGEEPVGAAARAKQAKLILLAQDCSPNTIRRAATFGQAGNVLHLVIPCTKEEIGFSMGRNSVAMLALTDAGLAGAIGDRLAALDPDRYAAAQTQLRAKADRTLARQKEKRQHEKNLQRGKGKPWAVPTHVQEERESKRKAKKEKIEYEDVYEDLVPVKRNYGKGKPHGNYAKGTGGNHPAKERGNFTPKSSSGSSFRNDKKPYTGKKNDNKDNRHSHNENRKTFSKPAAGKKLVIKRRTGRPDQS